MSPRIPTIDRGVTVIWQCWSNLLGPGLALWVLGERNVSPSKLLLFGTIVAWWYTPQWTESVSLRKSVAEFAVSRNIIPLG